MAKPAEIHHETQLLVEGRDGLNFFKAFVRHFGIEQVQVQDFGSRTELRAFLEAFVGMPGFREKVQGIGIVRDAEGDANGAFESVRSSLRNVGLPVPSQPAVRSGVGPTAAVLILPGNGRDGMLETLLWESLRDAPERRCVDEFLRCVTDSRSAPVRNPDKARTFAYLAAGEEPRHSVGVAAQRGHWDFCHDAFAGVRQFLGAL